MVQLPTNEHRTRLQFADERIYRYQRFSTFSKKSEKRRKEKKKEKIQQTQNNSIFRSTWEREASLSRFPVAAIRVSLRISTSPIPVPSLENCGKQSGVVS